MIPTNLRVPFVYVQFDSSNANQGSSIQEYNVLLMGQKLASGTKAELVPTVVTNKDEAKNLFGAGSQIHHMIEKYLKNNTITKLTVVALDDAAAGVAATGSIALTGTATKAGTLSFYIAGRVVQVAVAVGDTAAVVGAALEAAITADTDLPVSGVDTAGTVALTAKNKGECGNSIDLRMNYYDEETPEGLSVAITAMNSGVTNPDVDEVWPVIGEDQFNIVINPWIDAANLGKIETELADRFGPIRQNDGYSLSAATDTLGNLSTLGESRNSAFTSIMGSKGPSSPWEWAAALAGVVALYGQVDPARPFQTLELAGILAPSVSERFTLSERNILLFDGIATFKVGAGSKVLIERVITTYKKNAAGADDTAYLDLNTLLTISYLRFDYRTTMLTKFPRHKLADDGVRFAPGQKVLTPKTAKAEAVAMFIKWAEMGLVEGIEQFKNDLVVARSATDPNRLESILPPNLINQLRVVGSTIGFLL